MLSHREVVPKRLFATSVAIAFALCLLGSQASAQVTIQPKAEIYGGYSWLHPNGFYGQFNNTIKTADIVNGFDVSGVYYLPSMNNLGVLIDGSYHWNKSANPGGLDAFIGLAGLQYKWHSDQLSPFVRAFAGADHLSFAFPGSTEWRFAMGGGGGLDLSVTKRFSIRVAQADYIYTTYNPQGARPFANQTQWNMIRLSAGVVFNLGNYNLPPVTAACTATPTEVMQGEPVKVTATGTNFNPKHHVTYAWTSNGGKVSTADAQTATIDTTGVAGGSYTANATITDPKYKKDNVATCSASFTVKEPPKNPPVVSCSVSPSTVQPGSPVAITANVSSPDNSPISSVSYSASAGKISGSGNTATHDTTGLSAGPVTVTVTATDARGLTGTGSCSFGVEVPPPPPSCSARTPIEFVQRPHQKYIPWRVDNTAKAILDDDASALKNDPNAKIVVVGYADGEPPVYEGKGKNRHQIDLAAQRAVNTKAYLVQQQGIDPSRIEVRKGTGKDHTADIIWIPQGADVNACANLQNTTPVDESVVKPSENAYPKPPSAAPTHHRAKKAAAPAAQ